MNKLESFPLTLAAVKKGEKSLWDIGDALLDECGPPDAHGGDHKEQKLEAARLYLLANGYDYSRPGLSNLRRIAYRFPSSARNSEIAWSAHAAAGTPERLNAIIASTNNIADVTARHVEKIIDAKYQEQRLIRENEERQARAQLEEAEKEQKAAEAAERKAKDQLLPEAEQQKAKEKREIAEQRTEQAKAEVNKKRTPPKRSDQKIEKEEAPYLLKKLKLFSLPDRGHELAMDATKLFDDIGNCLDKDVLAQLVLESLEAANQWSAFADHISKSNAGVRYAHLSVVGKEESGL
jgi:hypothetical protein